MLPLLAAGGALVKWGAKKYAKSYGKTILGGLLGGGKAVVKAATSPAGTLAIAGTALLAGGGGGGGGVPALPGGVMAPSQFPGTGGLPWWKGPGGKLQAPWSDPRVPEILKSFSLDDAYLKTYYRAPKGYIVLRDSSGRPFACLKTIAKQFGLWHAKPKPIISIRDWHSYQRAERVEKKLLHIAKRAMAKRGHRRALSVVSHKK